MKENEYLKQIKYLVVDVDGTMTDGGIYYDNNGNELKKFNTRDAVGFFAARKAGIKILVLTGRESPTVKKRMKELKVDFLEQNIKDKEQYIVNFMQMHSIKKEQLGYIGDDLNDLKAMKHAGFIACPKDSCEEIKSLANYLSNMNGGSGAVRDIISFILKERNEWDMVIRNLYE